MAGQGPVVPKFGSWDAENIGYTVFFDKVRENKTAPTPASAATPAPAPKSAAAYDDYEFDPYEHYENLSRNVPSRPPSSHGHGHAPAHHHHRQPPPQQHHHHHYPALASQRGGNGGGGGYHRRSGSNGSSCAASEASSRGSKFSPPKPYQPRYTNNNSNSGGGYDYGATAYAPAPQRHHYHQHQHHHHQQQHAAAPARVVAASPPRHQNAPSPPRHHNAPPPHATKAQAATAVPKFGVWDEQNAAAAGQGFTVQFEKVKRHREVAKAAAAAAAAAPDVAPRMSPEMGAAPVTRRPRRKAKKSFLSKVYRCMFPRVRE